MSRQLSPNTAPFEGLGNYVYKETEGGFGANSYNGIKEKLNAVDTSNVYGPGGVIKIDEEGKAIIGHLGVAANTVTIEGPYYLNRDSITVYTITDYDSSKEYTAYISSGTVTVDNNTIIIGADVTEDAVTLIINGRRILIRKEPGDIETPVLTVNLRSYRDGKVDLMLNSSAFTGLELSHGSTRWEVASDVNFTDIIKSSEGANNLTSILFEGIDYRPEYYCRVKYFGIPGGYSNWSLTKVLTVNS